MKFNTFMNFKEVLVMASNTMCHITALHGI